MVNSPSGFIGRLQDLFHNRRTNRVASAASALLGFIVLGWLFYSNTMTSQEILQTSCLLGFPDRSSELWSCHQLSQAAIVPLHLFDAMSAVGVGGCLWFTARQGVSRSEATAQLLWVKASICLILTALGVAFGSSYQVGLYAGWPVSLMLRDLVAGLLYG